MELEAEKPTLTAFERFFYWFFIPFIFCIVLLGALLSLFEYDLKGQLMRFGSQVPGLSSILPDSEGKAAATDAGTTGQGATAPSSELEADETAMEAILQLEQQLASMNSELQGAISLSLEKDQTIANLQAELALAEEYNHLQAASDEEYQAFITETAAMYALMSPGKAASIMENLTRSEQVLLLSEMRMDDRVRILERMDPRVAAEASIRMKDAVHAKDIQIAALQERLDLNNTAASNSESSTLTLEELGRTFASMSARSAAALLIEMNLTVPDKVVDIIGSMDTASRSAVMTAIAEASRETAAEITAKLAP